MLRSAIFVTASLFAAMPMPAIAQTASHNFSGLCAFYPAHGDGMTNPPPCPSDNGDLILEFHLTEVIPSLTSDLIFKPYF